MKTILIPENILETVNGKKAFDTFAEWDKNSPYTFLPSDDIFYFNVTKLNPDFYEILKNNLFEIKNDYILNISPKNNRILNTSILVPGTINSLHIHGNLTVNIKNIKNFIWEEHPFDFEKEIEREKYNINHSFFWDTLIINASDKIKFCFTNDFYNENGGIYSNKIVVNAKKGIFTFKNQQNIKQIIFNLTGNENELINNKANNKLEHRLTKEWENHFLMYKNFEITIENCKNLEYLDLSCINTFCYDSLHLVAINPYCILKFNKNLAIEYDYGNGYHLSSALVDFSLGMFTSYSRTKEVFRPFKNVKTDYVEIRFLDFIKLFNNEIINHITFRTKIMKKDIKYNLNEFNTKKK